jgi:oligosaccharide repeat unit polymerase
MNFLSLICFFSALILITSLLKKNADIFSPSRLFIIIWLIAIGLTELKFSKLQREWSVFNWVILLIPLISTLAGMFIIYVINFEKPVMQISSIRQVIRNYSIDSKTLFRYIIFLFIAYIISYFITYLIVGYITIFTQKPDLARRDWQLFGLGLFVQSIPAILFLIVVYFVMTKSKLSKRLILLIIFLIAFITYLLLLQRYYIIFSIIISIVFLYYSTKKISGRNIIIFVSILSVIFYWVSSIRLSRYASNFLYYLSEMKFNIKYSIFTEPYMYVVMNLENFVHAVDKLKMHTYGLFTFDFLFAITGIKHPLATYLNLNDFPDLITSNFNTYTMYFIFYRDFNIVGLSLIPFILGMIFSASYYKMRRYPDPVSISIYSIIVFLIIFSFFVPLLSFLHFVFNFLVILIVTKIICYKQNGILQTLLRT